MPLPRRLGFALSCAALLSASLTGPAFADSSRIQTGKAAVESSTTVVNADQAQKQRSKATRQETKRGEAIAARAREYVGYPYRWGGSSPAGFDCSGFIMYVYGAFGIELGHDLGTQLASGRPIDPDQLLPGDVVIFQNTYKAGISHGGIYVGRGLFVHSNDESTGVVVSSVESDYWAPRFYGASRPGR